MLLSDYSEIDFSDAFEYIYESITAGLSESDNPRAFILGGHPGSGKTVLHRLHLRELYQNAVVINGDDYRRFHPNFEQIVLMSNGNYIEDTRVFSGKMVEKLIDICSDRGFNLIIEGTLRNASVPIETCAKLKAKNYNVYLSVMAVHPIFSYLGTIQRYEKEKEEKSKSPRLTTKRQHDIVVAVLPTSLKKICSTRIFDVVHLYNREGIVVASSEDDSIDLHCYVNNLFNSYVSQEEEINVICIKHFLLRKYRGRRPDSGKRLRRIAVNVVESPDLDSNMIPRYRLNKISKPDYIREMQGTVRKFLYRKKYPLGDVDYFC